MINTLDQRMEAVKNRLAAGGQWKSHERKIGKKNLEQTASKRMVLLLKLFWSTHI